MPRQRDPLREYRLAYIAHGLHRGRYAIRYNTGQAILFQDDQNGHLYTGIPDDDMVMLTGDTDLFNLAKTIHAHMQEAPNATTSTTV